MAKKNNKDGSVFDSTLLPVILGIATLIVLTFGATFAYFGIYSGSSTSSIRTNTNVDSIGSVNLNRLNTNLNIHLTSESMSKRNQDVNYYASSSGRTDVETVENIGEIVAVGNGTFSCEYDMTMSATATNNMYTAFQNMSNKSNGQIILKVNDVDYDFNTANLFPKVVHNTVTGVVSGTPKYIKASLLIVNKSNIDQSSLAGTDITISFTISNFVCVPI